MGERLCWTPGPCLGVPVRLLVAIRGSRSCEPLPMPAGGQRAGCGWGRDLHTPRGPLSFSIPRRASLPFCAEPVGGPGRAGPGGGRQSSAMTAEEKRSLQCYRRYIERSLNPVYVLGNMTDWLPDGEPPPPHTLPRAPGGVPDSPTPPRRVAALTGALLCGRAAGEDPQGGGEGGERRRRALPGRRAAAGGPGVVPRDAGRDAGRRWV